MCGAPVAHDETIISPLISENVGQEPLARVYVGAIDAGVTSHEAPWLG